jgi:hypothetical protein
MTKNTANEIERMVVTRIFDAPREFVWKASTEVCTGSARTKEQSQRCIHSLVPTMGLNVRSAYKDGYARNSSWPGEKIST